VRQVAEATTEPVSVKDARSRVRDGVTVGLVDASVRLAQPQNANVTVEILPAPVEKRMPDVPVRWRNLGNGLRAQVSPQLVHVTVRGSKEPLADLRGDNVLAFVDLAGLGSGRYNLRVQVDPAERFGVVAIDPAVVSVTIK
jgi:YbbR domain-containing protein